MTKLLQFHFRQQTYFFRFRLGFFLLCSFFTLLFCLLGVWQLHRYHFKKDLLETYQTRLSAAPLPFSQVKNNLAQLPFQKISATGIYLNQFTFFLQNQFYHDQLGFDVLTPLQIAGEKKLLLIDRGWIKSDSEQLPPNIPAITQPQTIQGYIKVLNEYQFLMGKNLIDPARHVLQKIDLQDIAGVTGKEFYPVVIRLNAQAPNGFTRDWPITNVIPERHMAYAVQWFAMAFVLVIAYICFGVSDREKK